MEWIKNVITKDFLIVVLMLAVIAAMVFTDKIAGESGLSALIGFLTGIGAAGLKKAPTTDKTER